MIYNQDQHIPVLIDKIIDILLDNIADINSEKVFVDCTFGNGGYTKRLLDTFPKSRVIAIDRDKNVIDIAEEFSKNYGDRFKFFNDVFSNIGIILKSSNIDKVDGIFMDLGVSSMQLDNGDRGFSFRENAPLDMRMGLCEKSAYDVVNYSSEKQLEHIIKELGEESRYKQIVKRIIDYRRKKKIETTFELADIIKSTYWHYSKIHPATKTFQAVRIFVNKELEEIEKNVKISVNFLKKNGCMFVVSFHSLEDRVVKHFFKGLSREEYVLLCKKPITADDHEVAKNTRAHSAKMRVICKKS